VRHAQANDGFCARMLVALHGERSKFTRGIDFDMFSISKPGVLVKTETRKVRCVGQIQGWCCQKIAIGCNFAGA